MHLILEKYDFDNQADLDEWLKLLYSWDFVLNKFFEIHNT